MVPQYVEASINPIRNRTAQSWVYVLHAALHMVKPAQRRHILGNQIRGGIFWMAMPCGIWPIT